MLLALPPALVVLRRMRQPADVIVGRRAARVLRAPAGPARGVLESIRSRGSPPQFPDAGVGRSDSRSAPRARLDSGLAPTTEGWFVVNVRDAAWLARDAFGPRCVFEANGAVLRRRPDLDPITFPDLGCALAVLQPGQPSGLYHAESCQEGFLVLAGECVLLVEGQERPLRAWDFVHCPPGTAHAFVGAGMTCVIFMVGARSRGRSILYPVSETARRRRGRRGRDRLAVRGVRAVSALAARASKLERAAVGLSRVSRGDAPPQRCSAPVC